MSEDRIIISVLPFENPKNDAERQINDEAMKFYLDPVKRENGNGICVFTANPDHPGHMYHCSAGWTKEGWRTYTTCMDAEQLVNFCDVAVTAEEEVLRFLDEVERSANKN